MYAIFAFVLSRPKMTKNASRGSVFDTKYMAKIAKKITRLKTTLPKLFFNQNKWTMSKTSLTSRTLQCDRQKAQWQKWKSSVGMCIYVSKISVYEQNESYFSSSKLTPSPPIWLKWWSVWDIQTTSYLPWKLLFGFEITSKGFSSLLNAGKIVS